MDAPSDKTPGTLGFPRHMPKKSSKPLLSNRVVIASGTHVTSFDRDDHALKSAVLQLAEFACKPMADICVMRTSLLALFVTQVMSVAERNSFC